MLVGLGRAHGVFWYVEVVSRPLAAWVAIAVAARVYFIGVLRPCQCDALGNTSIYLVRPLFRSEAARVIARLIVFKTK